MYECLLSKKSNRIKCFIICVSSTIEKQIEISRLLKTQQEKHFRHFIKSKSKTVLHYQNKRIVKVIVSRSRKSNLPTRDLRRKLKK